MWYVDDQGLEWPYDWNEPLVDIHLGVPIVKDDIHNLTMVIDGTNLRNNTRIKCIASFGTSLRSSTAFLRIYGSFY